MGAIASQITSHTIVYSTVYKGWATRKMFPFDDVIMTNCLKLVWTISANREEEANYSHQVDLTHWNISSKMIVKNHTYTKLEVLVLIFTRLRIDMNVLSTCRINKTIAPACPLCSESWGPGSALHFVLKYPVHDRQRNLFIDKIVPRSPSFPNLDDVQKLKYIVDLDCPPEVISQCCKFVAEIYALRERQSTANNWWSNMTCIGNHQFTG